MPRQRKLTKDLPDAKVIKQNQKVKRIDQKPKRFFSVNWIYFLMFVLVGAILYVCYNYYLEHLITTPLNLPKVIVPKKRISMDDRYWGSYRSGHYFGMKTRHPNSPVVGLMWFAQKIVDNSLKIRHWCDAGDRLKSYGWLQHDGINFGVQEILDQDMNITTAFVKRPGGDFGGDWTARISMKPIKVLLKQSKITYSFFVYSAIDGEGSIAPVIQDDNRLVTIVGFSKSLGTYAIHFIPRDVSSVIRYNFLNTVAPPGMVYLKEVAMKNLALFKTKHGQVLGLSGNVFPKEKGSEVFQGNYIVHQVTFSPPFEMDIVFESKSFINRPNRLNGELFDEELNTHKDKFKNKFSDTFQLPLKGYSDEEVKVAEATLSNMIGGIGYFYGSSVVQSVYNKEPVEYWEAPLYTAVPCRSIFPRGFLWDEGFHNLLLNRWDVTITKDILGHWLDLMNVEGWIPREQILGAEARARVPAEFLIQRNANGNPPALLLTFDMLVRKMLSGEIEKDTEFLHKSFLRLQVLFNWFNSTQAGIIPGTYRWRGRQANAIHELNPQTLTSGFDDYPRASDPTEDERHIDLRCWLAFAANVLQEIARMVGEKWTDYAATYKYLSDNEKLQQLHWNEESKSFCDYGYHTDDVKLVKVQGETEKVRVELTPPKLQFVNSFGYVSMFPFLLQILRPENPVLAKVLFDLRDPQLLWTDYGLRSLAQTAPLYMKYNTEHNPPYWRGAIWINMNYLILKALNYYSEIPGPYQENAQSLYNELRKNVVSNVIKNYKRSGYIWEHYNDKTGVGEGGHPFTGWSATFVLIMAEIY